MEAFKIEHFIRDNPDKKFPQFVSLDSDQSNKIHRKLSDKLRIAHPPEKVVKKLKAMGFYIEDDNAESEGFILKKIFEKVGIYPQEKVYINWHHFDDIDQMGFDDLSTYFDEIWYPGSDDIDIFDATFSWVLSVHHDGSIQVVKQ